MRRRSVTRVLAFSSLLLASCVGAACLQQSQQPCGGCAEGTYCSWDGTCRPALSDPDASTGDDGAAAETPEASPSGCAALADGADCGTGMHCCGGACVSSADPAHCGASCSACPADANQVAGCVAGACSAACAGNFADCDATRPGCETNLGSDSANCGACGAACGVGLVCTNGTCQPPCPAGKATCAGDPAGSCATDLTSNASNCGACGTSCNAGPNVASGSCAARACKITACVTGFQDCDGKFANGCEVDTRGDSANCGACGTTCPAPAHATPSCAGGKCSSTCNAGFGNCDHSADGSCETNVAGSDAMNCGGCGVTCLGDATTTRACQAGACVVTGCAAGYTNCGGVCANLQADPFHCGNCTTMCPPNPTTFMPGSCVAGTCATAGACIAPNLQTCSDGKTHDLSRESHNSGACGNQCGWDNCCDGCGKCHFTGTGNTCPY